MKQVYSFVLLFSIVILLSSFAVVYELKSDTFTHDAITGMVAKITQPGDKAATKMIPFYNLQVPAATSKDKVAVAAKVKEKLDKDKKVRVIVNLKEPDKIKGWSSTVSAMGKNELKNLQKTMRDSAIDDIGKIKVKHKYSSFNGFSAALTQKELNVLSASGMVASIEYDEPFYISLQDSTGIINATESWSLQYGGVNLTGAGQTVCVIDTGVDYTHPDLGGCEIKNVSLDGNILDYSQESEHPYEDNKIVTYKINYTGFDSIAVHFINISMESHWDYIKILDGNQNQVAIYSGYHTDLWSPNVDGNTIYVQLVADDYVNDFGFYIDKIINGTTNTTPDWSNCSKVIGGWDVVNSDYDPMDDNDHGTHCAGIVAANGNIKGVAPDAQIVAVKVFPLSGPALGSDILAGVEYCINNAVVYNISVISMSLGGGLYSDYCDNVSGYSGLATAINSAVANNISVIVASGNDGSSSQILSPACIQNAIPVGATDKDDSIASYSNRNENMLQLFAPGTGINSTWYPGGGYEDISGTSMATPHVAGAFAIMNQYLELSGQTKTPQELESIFNRTGKLIPDSATGMNYYRINLYEALLELDEGVDIEIISPAAGYITTEDYVLINITSNENIYNVTLHFVNTSQNISMNGSGDSWYYNLSGSGLITFFVTAEDFADNIGQSETLTIFLNNSAPNITNSSPAASVVNITELENQIFSIEYDDGDWPYTSVRWYLNSTLVANGTTEWNFTGNDSSAGSYNISVIVNDSILQDNHSWILNVNDSNSPPQWNHSFTNLTLLEDSSITYNVNATDAENDNITYYADNVNSSIGNVSINSSTGLINFTPAQDWYGFLSVTVTASDGLSNTTGELGFNVTPVNDAPTLEIQDSVTIDEDTSIIMDVNLTDVDDDASDITWNCSSSEPDIVVIDILEDINGTNVSSLNITASNNFDDIANVTCIIFDLESLNDSGYFIVNVTAVNDPPVFHLPDSVAFDEGTSTTIVINITDVDNDDLYISWNCSSNETNVILAQIDSILNITASSNFSGFANITCLAFDPELVNSTEYFIANITHVNNLPQFDLIYNTTYNENEIVNITVINATDIDGDNLTYSINDSSRFNQSNNLFIWNTTILDSGTYSFTVYVNDSYDVVEEIINIIILDVEDIDNDGVNDTVDYLIGDVDTIISNISLDLSIGNLTDFSEEITGTYEINISHDGSSLLEFNWTFSNTSKLNLSALILEKELEGADSGYFIVKGLNLVSPARTKTVYVVKGSSSISTICIKDAEIDSIDEISALCNEADETPLRCPGGEDGYNCTLSGNTFVITGLSHSGVLQQTYCGDGTKDAEEECEGSNLGGQTCSSLGYDFGTLSCKDDCTFNVGPCGHTYTSSGGGGGGGSSIPTGVVPTGPKYSKYYANLDSGDLEVEIPNPGIPIRKLTMKAYSQNTKVNFIFQRVDDISFIDKPLEGVYHYLRIEAEGLNPGSIASYSFTFDIKKSWFDAYDTNNVYLQRYHGGVWEKNRAVFEKEVNDTYVYRAETKGMSYFAITSDSAIPEREAKIEALDVASEDEKVADEEEPDVAALEEEPDAEEIIDVAEEDKGPGFFSTSWERVSGFVKRNIMVLLLVIIVLALLGGTGFNMYYYYIKTFKGDEGDSGGSGESEAGADELAEEPEEEKTVVKESTKENMHSWAKDHVKKGFSIDEIKVVLAQKGYKKGAINKIISSLEGDDKISKQKKKTK